MSGKIWRTYLRTGERRFTAEIWIRHPPENVAHSRKAILRGFILFAGMLGYFGVTKNKDSTNTINKESRNYILHLKINIWLTISVTHAWTLFTCRTHSIWLLFLELSVIPSVAFICSTRKSNTSLAWFSTSAQCWYSLPWVNGNEKTSYTIWIDV